MNIPKFGVGTFRLKGDIAFNSVSNALKLGYKAVDTAQGYDNEEEVGKAIAGSGLNRNDLFITTKIAPENCNNEKLIASLEISLKKLQTNYVDLTLIHWPAPKKGVSIKEMMSLLLETKKMGLSKKIGVSNFNIDCLKQAIDAVGLEELATNQIELHPYLQNHSLVKFCKEQNIHITSYMTLAYGKVLQDPEIQSIASEHKATPAQVALAWALQSGFVVIPSSTKPDNLKSNLLAQNLKLTDNDMKRIKALDRNERLANPKELAPEWDV